MKMSPRHLLSDNTKDTGRLLFKIFLILSMISIPSILFFMPKNDVKDLLYQYSYSDSNIIRSELINSPSNVELSPSSTRMKRFPQAILIGIMKGGTRALLTMMEMHSKFVAPQSEMHFFNDRYKLGMDWYKQQMPVSYADQITLEKTPSYFKINNLDVPLRIHSMNSSIRLLLIVRDPVTRAISHYAHSKKLHGRSLASFEKLLFDSSGVVNMEDPRIVGSLYDEAFKLYLEVFPREQILVVDGNQLIIDPLPIIQRVEKFLHLEPQITEENLYFDKQKGFYCMKKNGKGSCLEKNKGLNHPEIDEDVLKKLREFFAPHNQRFYDLVGQDFGWDTL